MTTIFYVPKNNVADVLASMHTAGSGTLQVTNGSMFGSPSSSAPIRVTVTDGTHTTIFKVTGVTGNLLTNAIAIEGTLDYAYASGSSIEMRITAGAISDLNTAVNALETTGGPQGDQGAQGNQGQQGSQGNQGLQGLTGLGGNDGTDGSIGPQGDQGQPGNQGTQGQIGSTGLAGTPGATGSQGNQGTQGNTGQTGPTGNQGFQGNQGITGQSITGPQGTTGLTGATGPQGWTGFQGNPGTQGNQGIQGDSIQGTQGNQGNQGSFGGPQGDQGSQGNQGYQGPQGNDGINGTQGNQGNQGLVADGLVSTSSASGSQSLSSASSPLYVDSMIATIDPPTTSDIVCIFTLKFQPTVVRRAVFYFRFVMDGTTFSPYYTHSTLDNATLADVWTINMHHVFEGVSSGNHTVKIQWSDGGLGLDISVLDRRLTTFVNGGGPQGNQGSQGAFGGPQGNQGSQGSQGVQGSGIQGTQGNQGFLGGMHVPYAYNASTSLPSGGSETRFNNTTYSSVTQISVNKTSWGSVYQGNLLTNVPVGSVVGFIDGNGNYVYFSVTAITNNASEVTFAVTYLTSSGAFADGEIFYFTEGPAGQGTQGNQGYQGIIGTQGSQGYQGTQGVQGVQGVQGNQGNIGNQGNQGYLGGMQIPYNFGTSTTLPAASQQVLFNNGTYSSVTQISVSKTSADSADQTTLLSNLPVGSILGFIDTLGVYAYFSVTNVSVNSTEVTYTVTALTSSGAFTNSERIYFVEGPAGVANNSFGNQNSNTIFAGPTTGLPATPTFRVLDFADIPSGITNITYASTVNVDLSQSRLFSVTLAGNPIITTSNVKNGWNFILALKQDATGSRTVTWFSGISWANGITPTLTTTANKTDVFEFVPINSSAFYGFVKGQNL